MDSGDGQSTSVCDVMILVWLVLMMTVDTVLMLLSSYTLRFFDYLLGVFQFHLAAPYEIVWGVLVYSHRNPKVPRHFFFLFPFLCTVRVAGK